MLAGRDGIADVTTIDASRDSCSSCGSCDSVDIV